MLCGNSCTGTEPELLEHLQKRGFQNNAQYDIAAFFCGPRFAALTLTGSLVVSKKASSRLCQISMDLTKGIVIGTVSR